MRKDFYVYEWYNIDTNEVFYVGKGTGDRCKVVAGRNNYFKNYHNKYNCKVRKVKENLLEQDAFKLETELISKYKKTNQCQCNLTDGGEGAVFTEGSWDDMYRKLRMIYYNPNSKIDNMPNADEYYHENLKTKSLEELIQLYEDYKTYSISSTMNEDVYKDFKKSNPSHIDYTNMDAFEIVTINKEIRILTDVLANWLARNNSEYEDLLECKDEFDYLYLNINTDKFIYTLLQNVDYYINLVHAIISSMWILKRSKLPIKIKTFSFRDNRFLYIRLKTLQGGQLESIKLDLYDLVWGVLVFKDKSLHQIIYDEMRVAPFIQIIKQEEFSD